MFRQKDIWNWWSHPHYERVAGAELASPTAWFPQAKPIWITEVGCPAVDKGANQPSVFPDPKSSESGLPYFSNGKRDDLIQRRYLEAVLGAFDPASSSAATIRCRRLWRAHDRRPSIHLWTWDARPYPVFPAVDGLERRGNWEPAIGSPAGSAARRSMRWSRVLDDAGSISTVRSGRARTAMWSTDRCRRAPRSSR